MLARNIVVTSFAFAALGSLIASACTNATCTDLHQKCDGVASGGFAGVGGLDGTAGSFAGTDGGGEQGGMPVGGSAGGATAGSSGNGDAGAAGTAACADACKGTTPICDVAANTCVQCLKNTDCKDGTKPVCDAATNACVQCTKSAECTDSTKPACDTGTNSCVECVGNGDCKDAAKPLCDKTGAKCVACLKQTDCTSATASACNAGVCTACTTDAECSNTAGKGVCDAGTCVQCTVPKESVCGGKSCDPAAKRCTATQVGSKDLCEACIADSECMGGNKTDPDTRCVPMKFMGTPRAGGFCLRRFNKTCTKPYFMMPSDLVSLSGASSEAYCGIDQDATRCEAVLDLAASRPCPDGKDASCGCMRDTSGICTEPGQGGVCGTVLGTLNTCSIPCAVAAQCKSPLTCAPVDYCH